MIDYKNIFVSVSPHHYLFTTSYGGSHCINKVSVRRKVEMSLFFNSPACAHADIDKTETVRAKRHILMRK